MAKYWTASMQYSQMSVEELQKKAQESVKNAKNKGKEMHPIIVDGRQKAGGAWPGVKISNNMPIMPVASNEEKDMFVPVLLWTYKLLRVK